MESNVKVIARVKPLTDDEAEDGRCIHVTTSTDITLKVSGGLFSSRRFRLDAILDEDATQADVFKNIVPLLQKFLSGYNCTVFVYGQTGSGKTHTMLGYDIWAMTDETFTAPPLATDESMTGIIPRAMVWLFSEICGASKDDVSISISYLELYNDMKLYDLLSPADSPAQSLDIRETKSGEIIVPELTNLHVSSISEVLEALWRGAKFRRVAATDMNDYSSRSHTLFVVYVRMSGLSSKLHFVDLAGSEKWKTSQLAKLSVERVKELTSINRSLSALGNCVSALIRKNKTHVPYRDSKLTRLLQDSLGGNTLTLFVVTLSASVKNVEETSSTLQFSDRAMKVQILVTKNPMTPSNDSVDKLKCEIKSLKSLLHSALLKTGIDGIKDGSSETFPGFIEKLNAELQELRDENVRLLHTLKATQEQLESSQEESIRLMQVLTGFSGITEATTVSAEHSGGAIPLQNFSDDLKVTILQARNEEVDRRLQAAESIESIQEERWGLLLNYHSWLQSQTGAETADADTGIAVTDVYKKVQLMEGSLLVQADELHRAKKVFLQTNSQLHCRLSSALQENMKLRRRVDDLCTGGILRTDSSTLRTPCNSGAELAVGIGRDEDRCFMGASTIRACKNSDTTSRCLPSPSASCNDVAHAEDAAGTEVPPATSTPMETVQSLVSSRIGSTRRKGAEERPPSPPCAPLGFSLGKMSQQRINQKVVSNSAIHGSTLEYTSIYDCVSDANGDRAEKVEGPNDESKNKNKDISFGETSEDIQSSSTEVPNTVVEEALVRANAIFRRQRDRTAQQQVDWMLDMDPPSSSLASPPGCKESGDGGLETTESMQTHREVEDQDAEHCFIGVAGTSTMGACKNSDSTSRGLSSPSAICNDEDAVGTEVPPAMDTFDCPTPEGTVQSLVSSRIGSTRRKGAEERPPSPPCAPLGLSLGKMSQQRINQKVVSNGAIHGSTLEYTSIYDCVSDANGDRAEKVEGKNKNKDISFGETSEDIQSSSTEVPNTVVEEALVRANAIFRRQGCKESGDGGLEITKVISHLDGLEKIDECQIGESSPRIKVKKLKKSKKPKLLWQECIDHESGESYYYNRETRETTWDRPPSTELLKVFSRKDA